MLVFKQGKVVCDENNKEIDFSWKGMRNNNMEEKYWDEILKNDKDLTFGNRLGMISLCQL